MAQNTIMGKVFSVWPSFAMQSAMTIAVAAIAVENVLQYLLAYRRYRNILPPTFRQNSSSYENKLEFSKGSKRK